MKGSDREITFFRGKIKLLQHHKHKVSVDLVVFLSFLKGIKRTSKVVELGAGFGFLSISIAKKFGCSVTAVERNPEMLEFLRKNVNTNGLSEKINILEADIRGIEKSLSRGSFDVAVANPPFYPSSYGTDDGGFHFEGDTTLEDFIKAGAFLLRDGGYLNMLIPAFRLAESFRILQGVNLPPRFLRIVYPKPKREGKLCTIASVKNVPGHIRIEEPLLINDEGGGYTPDVERLLDGFL